MTVHRPAHEQWRGDRDLPRWRIWRARDRCRRARHRSLAQSPRHYRRRVGVSTPCRPPVGATARCATCDSCDSCACAASGVSHRRASGSWGSRPVATWRRPRALTSTKAIRRPRTLVDRVSCRPDFVMLVYPVITMGDRPTQARGPICWAKSPRRTGRVVLEREAGHRPDSTHFSRARAGRRTGSARQQSSLLRGTAGAPGPVRISRTSFRRTWSERLPGSHVGCVAGSIAGVARRVEEHRLRLRVLIRRSDARRWDGELLPQDKEFAARAWTVDNGTILASQYSMG